MRADEGDDQRGRGSGGARAAAVTLAGQWTKYALQLASLVVLARLLTPTDFGLIAMTTAVIGIANVLGDFGLSLAAIQARQLSQGQRSNLFWLNGAVGTITALVFVPIAPLLASFYNDPRLTLLTIALGSSFVVAGFTTQHRADLTRRTRFTSLALSDVLGQAAAFATAVLSAWAGAGYWALALQQIVFAVVSGVLVVSWSRWRPSRPSRAEPMRALLSYGGSTFLTQVVNYISANADSVLLGQRFGATVLGFYNRAFQLVSLPVQQLASPLTRIALPLLSRITEPAELTRVATKVHAALLWALLSILSVLAAMSEQVTSVVLGPGWSAAADLLPILAVGGAFQVLSYVYYWVFLATARTGLLFVSELSGRLVMIAGMIVFIEDGPAAVATASAAGTALIWAVGSFLTVKRTGIDPRPLLLTSARIVSAVGSGFLLVRGCMLFGLDIDGWPGLVVYLACWLLGAGSIACAQRASRLELQGVIVLLRRR